MENPGIREALTIEKAFWQSRKERRLYELRGKAIRDEVSALAGAGAEGEAGGKVAMAREAICKYLNTPGLGRPHGISRSGSGRSAG